MDIGTPKFQENTPLKLKRAVAARILDETPWFFHRSVFRTSSRIAILMSMFGKKVEFWCALYAAVVDPNLQIFYVLSVKFLDETRNICVLSLIITFQIWFLDDWRHSYSVRGVPLIGAQDEGYLVPAKRTPKEAQWRMRLELLVFEVLLQYATTVWFGLKPPQVKLLKFDLCPVHLLVGQLADPPRLALKTANMNLNLQSSYDSGRVVGTVRGKVNLGCEAKQWSDIMHWNFNSLLVVAMGCVGRGSTENQFVYIVRGLYNVIR